MPGSRWHFDSELAYLFFPVVHFCYLENMTSQHSDVGTYITIAVDLLPHMVELVSNLNPAEGLGKANW